MHQPRVLVITSCTGEKRSKPKNQLTLEDFKDSAQLQKGEAKLVKFACPAGQIYTGQQHLRTMEGVKLLRQSVGREVVDLVIFSAGYGLIPEEKTIVPYEVTFNTMKGDEVSEWAKFLGVHEAFEKALADYDLVFMLLGDNYLQSLNLPIETQPKQTLIFLTSNRSAKYVRDLTAKTFVLPLSNMEAKRYSYGLVGLKGFLFKRFTESVTKTPELLERIYCKPETFKTAIERESIQLELPLGLPKMEVEIKPSKTSKTKQSSKADEPWLLNLSSHRIHAASDLSIYQACL
jgi:hypothetical protein